MYDFTGQTAIVTGGTRSIGGAISTALLAAGARVIATYVGNDKKADEFRAQHTDAGDRLCIEKFDVAEYETVESFFTRYRETYGTLEILINNSGIRRDAVLAMMPRESWDRVMDVNLGGVFNMCKFGVQQMMTERYGRIVNLTSPSGNFGFEGQANYAASKAGMVALTRSLSKEVAKRKITVNCISPGFIETDLIGDLLPDQAKAYRQTVPLKRFGTPAEVAHAALFLCMKESAYITGSTIEVTGGL